MKPIEVSVVLTPCDGSGINVPAIRAAVRRIENSSGFSDPSFEGIKFYFAEVNVLYVRLRLGRLPADSPRHTLEAAGRTASRAGALLTAMLGEAYKCEAQLSNDSSSERGQMLLGEWMGSVYGQRGERSDYHLILTDNGCYKWIATRLSGSPHVEAGRWSYDETERQLSCQQDGENGSPPTLWRVMTLDGWEDSNWVLVLRRHVLAIRNPPILFYRVQRDAPG